ncbi:hypothetical protein AMTRI_Chr08g167270 [Amborella trichopoda]
MLSAPHQRVVEMPPVTLTIMIITGQPQAIPSDPPTRTCSSPAGFMFWGNPRVTPTHSLASGLLGPSPTPKVGPKAARPPLHVIHPSRCSRNAVQHFQTSDFHTPHLHPPHFLAAHFHTSYFYTLHFCTPYTIHYTYPYTTLPIHHTYPCARPTNTPYLPIHHTYLYTIPIHIPYPYLSIPHTHPYTIPILNYTLYPYPSIQHTLHHAAYMLLSRCQSPPI